MKEKSNSFDSDSINTLDILRESLKKIKDTGINIEQGRKQFDGRIKELLLDPSNMARMLLMLLRGPSDSGESAMIVILAKYYVIDMIQDMIESEDIFAEK